MESPGKIRYKPSTDENGLISVPKFNNYSNPQHQYHQIRHLLFQDNLELHDLNAKSSQIARTYSPSSLWAESNVRKWEQPYPAKMHFSKENSMFDLTDFSLEICRPEQIITPPIPSLPQVVQPVNSENEVNISYSKKDKKDGKWNTNGKVND